MQYLQLQKHIKEARIKANQTGKYIGILKTLTGSITLETLSAPPINGTKLTFEDHNRFKDCALLGYAFPLIPGKNKINPQEWRQKMIERDRENDWKN